MGGTFARTFISHKCNFIHASGDLCGVSYKEPTINNNKGTKSLCFYCKKKIVYACGERDIAVTHILPDNHKYLFPCVQGIETYWKFAPCSDCIKKFNITRCKICSDIKYNSKYIKVYCISCNKGFFSCCEECIEKYNNALCFSCEIIKNKH
jgi:hypothetical protein